MSKEMEELYHRLQYFEKIGVMRLKRGEQMEFPCPQCGGTAHAVRIASTNQLGVWCDRCGSLSEQPGGPKPESRQEKYWIFESGSRLREVVLLKRTGNMCTIRFADKNGGIRVPVSRLYTKEQAEKKLEEIKEKNRKNQYDYMH